MNILVVDDDLEQRTMLGHILSHAGFKTFLVASGKEAIQFLGQSSVELVISDLQMSDGDGRWLLREVQRLSRAPKIVIFSADPMATREELLLAGATAFFPKPSLHALLSYLYALK